MHFSGVNGRIKKNILHCGKNKKERIKEGHKRLMNYAGKNLLDSIIKIMDYKLNPRNSKPTFNPVF